MDNTKITLEISSMLLHKLSGICSCNRLIENPTDLVLECVKYTARNANSISSTYDLPEDQDDYEELVGSLDFDNL